MHLIDLSVNFMGTSAIVGNSIPIGVGLALSVKLRGMDRISCVFLGDGAIEEGVFYESVNFAAVRKLPVLFICENNLYSVYSPLWVRQPPGRSIASMVNAMGIDVGVADGMDIQSSKRLMESAINHVRRHGSPYFLEFSTYRWREHCGHAFDNDIGYRSQEEFLAWQAKDPLGCLEAELKNYAPTMNSMITEIKHDIDAEINAAFEFADRSPFRIKGKAKMVY